MRERIIEALPSRRSYLILYSLISLNALALIVWGKSTSEFSMIWQPVFELRFISHALMIPACVLVVAGNLPMSLMRKHLRNPMLLGVTFWGLSHLWSNGDLASIVLFGTFTLWAGFKFISMGFRPRVGTDKSTKELILWDGIALLAGLGFYVALSLFHGQLFGVGLSFV